jgi:hypothetical protein
MKFSYVLGQSNLKCKFVYIEWIAATTNFDQPFYPCPPTLRLLKFHLPRATNISLNYSSYLAKKTW